MTGVGLAGLDENRRLNQCHSALGITSDERGNRWDAARYGIAGNGSTAWNTVDRSCGFGIAGLDHRGKLNAAHGAIEKTSGSGRLGDIATDIGWRYGVYFADFSYVICTADHGRGEVMRWRKGRKKVFSREKRILPLFFDSTAYRRWTGTAPKWVSYDTYIKAIDLAMPNGFCSYDVIGDQDQSLEFFERMKGDGYGPDRGCFPVYHVRPRWDDAETVRGVAWRSIPDAARTAVANARKAVGDPVMRYYASQSRVIGLGGMVRGPVPRDYRHYYIAELCRLMPDHQFWALGQANFKVVNGLGAMGLLNRVWTDGSWWILDAACERFAVVMDGQICMHSLEGIAQSFFTITECMAANLRSLLVAYRNSDPSEEPLWSWPPPDPLPLDQNDREQAEELYGRVRQARLELFGDEEVRMCGNVPVRVVHDEETM